MATVVPFPSHSPRTPREQLAAEVRAALARARLNPTRLARLVGHSQPYWYRRVAGELPLDIDDLAAVAGVLGIDVADFFRYSETGPTPHDNSGKGHTRRPRSDSNGQPTDWASAQVISLDEYRTNRSAA